MAPPKNSDPNGETQVPPIPPKDGRAHKATYARDKRQGGYLVRITGPRAKEFRVGQYVPVTRMDGSENMEQLNGLVWQGTDEDTSAPCALYQMTKRARAVDAIEF